MTVITNQWLQFQLWFSDGGLAKRQSHIRHGRVITPNVLWIQLRNKHVFPAEEISRIKRLPPAKPRMSINFYGVLTVAYFTNGDRLTIIQI